MSLLADPPIPLAGHIASRKMQQPGVIRPRTNSRMLTAASVLVASASRRSGLKSVRPELLMIRSRFFCSRRAVSASSPSPAAYIAFDHLDLLAQKLRKPVAIPLKQRIENRRFFHHLLEAPLRRIRLLPPDQQIDPFHIRANPAAYSPATPCR